MPDREVWRKAPLIRVDGKRPDERVIHQAALIIRQGGVAAYPTESFYGLGVDPAREDAVNRVFQMKEREKNRPILILIPSIESLDSYVTHVSVAAHALIDAFWPGGLTLVFDASDRVPKTVTAGTGKIGIRLSSHPVAASLVRILGAPITSTSANLSGKGACRSGEEVLQQFGKKVDIVLDGGPAMGKSASTVLDVSVDPPRILRQGMVSKEQLESVISARIFLY